MRHSGLMMAMVLAAVCWGMVGCDRKPDMPVTDPPEPTVGAVEAVEARVSPSCCIGFGRFSGR